MATSTQATTGVYTWNPGSVPYGVTEAKKAELDALAIKVQDAQYVVNNYQSIVNSLTAKESTFQAFFTAADANRTTTYNNKLLLNQLIQSSKNLKNNASSATGKMTAANTDTQTLGSAIEQIVRKLIYSVDVINKLSNMIIKKKAVNPLISDELITLVATAGSDANNAIALTLVALQSTFAAQASNMESLKAIVLADDQSHTLYDKLVGPGDKKNDGSIKSLLDMAYTNAVANYNRIQKALRMITTQLSDANAELAVAQINLQSLQLGLAAATAAAFA